MALGVCLSPTTSSTASRSHTAPDVELEGRIAHELAHKLGGWGAPAQFCPTTSAVMRGADGGNGLRLHNTVTAVDVDLMLQAYEHPETCTGKDGDGLFTEETEASPLAQQLIESQSPGHSAVGALGGYTAPPDRENTNAIARSLASTSEGVLSMAKMFGGLLLVMLLVGPACRQRPVENSSGGSLSISAAHAKQRGEKSVRLRELAALDTQSALDDVISASAILIGLGGDTKLEVTPGSITTWQYLKVSEWLQRSTVKPQDNACLPSSPATAAGQVVTPFGRGTAMVDGVQITNENETDVALERGRRYLILGHECANNTLVRPWGKHGMFQVDDAGRISLPTFNPGIAAYAQEVASLGTIGALRARIQTAKR